MSEANGNKNGDAELALDSGAFEAIPNEEYVRWAYRLLLGREPENEAVIRNNPFICDRQRLVQWLINSDEFRAVNRAVRGDTAANPFLSWGRDALIFIHLPKAGGSTLHALLKSCFSENRICPERFNNLHLKSPSELAAYDFFSGHFDYFSTHFIPRRRICRISLLRDPRQRLISAYRFSRAHPPHGEFAYNVNVRLANELDPEEFFEHEYVISSTWMNNAYLFCFGSSLDDVALLDRLTNDRSPAREAGSSKVVHTSTALRPESAVIVHAVDRAKQVVSDLDAIGLTERYDKSVKIIFSTLGFEVPPSISAVMVTDDLANRDSRLSRVPPVRMTPRLSQALERLTKYDRVIYDWAWQEFERRSETLTIPAESGGYPETQSGKKTRNRKSRWWARQWSANGALAFTGKSQTHNDKERDESGEIGGSVGARFDDGEAVRWAYRLLLGREPESLGVIRDHPYKNDWHRLVRGILNSDEFAKSNSLTLPLKQDSALGGEFDIDRLRDRTKRLDNIGELRRRAIAVPMSDGMVLCRTLGKYKHYVSKSDVGLSPFLILDGFFEYFITEFVVRNVSRGMTVIDLGANYGYYTLLMADLVGQHGKVYAFEPNPAAISALGRSLSANNYDRRVVIDRRAVWNRSEERVTFHVPELAATTARVVWPLDSRLPPSDPGALDADTETVGTVALDDLPLEGVSFIKADIEGAEERLWQGGRRFFGKNPDVIFLLEFNRTRCQDPRSTLEDMTTMFSLRYLDGESNVRDVTPEQVLSSEHDWMLVLTRREGID